MKKKIFTSEKKFLRFFFIVDVFTGKPIKTCILQRTLKHAHDER